MKRFKRLHNIAAVLLALIFLNLTAVISGVGGNAYAAESVSNVLDDLRKDGNFNFAEYPENTQDYSLQIIQIAESTDGELLIYVYQPSGTRKNLRASTISIAREPDNSNDLNFTPYSLRLQSANGVFFKYKVLNFKISPAVVRFYNISNILRPFNEMIDKPPEGDNTSSEVPYAVGQLWTASTTNGNVSYNLQASEIIEVTQKYVGMLRYSDGYWFAGFMACDSHYIAFSTDKPMDKLLSADVHYKTRTVERNYMFGIQSSEKFGPQEETTATLNSDDLGSNSPRGWFSEKKSWYVIQQASAFIEENQDLNDAAIDNIKNKQWVIRFAETSFQKDGDYKLNREISCEVTDVIILRLKFETDGKVYNLGVVDNKQTGTLKPDNANNFDFWQWLADLLGVPRWAATAIFWGLLALIVLAVLLPVLSLIFPAFGQILKAIAIAIGKALLWLLKALLWLVTLPFRAIAALINKRKSTPAKPARRTKTKPRKKK